MDNKLERALSSMTDLKKVLRNNVPRVGRRKSSSASPAALSSIDKAVTDEEANALYVKVLHIQYIYDILYHLCETRT